MNIQTNNVSTSLNHYFKEAVKEATFQVIQQASNEDTVATLKRKIQALVASELQMVGVDIKRQRIQTSNNQEEEVFTIDTDNNNNTIKKKKPGQFIQFQKWGKQAVVAIRKEFFQDRTFYCELTNNAEKRTGRNYKRKLNANKEYIEYWKPVGFVAKTNEPIEEEYYAEKRAKFEADTTTFQVMSLAQLLDQKHNDIPLQQRLKTSIQTSVDNILDGLIWRYCLHNEQFINAFRQICSVASDQDKYEISPQLLRQVYLQDKNVDINNMFVVNGQPSDIAQITSKGTKFNSPETIFDQELGVHLDAREPTQKQKQVVKDILMKYSNDQEISSKLYEIFQIDNDNEEETEIDVDINSLDVRMFRHLECFVKRYAKRNPIPSSTVGREDLYETSEEESSSDDEEDPRQVSTDMIDDDLDFDI